MDSARQVPSLISILCKQHACLIISVITVYTNSCDKVQVHVHVQVHYYFVWTKERLEQQTSIQSIEPGLSDWESSALSTKALLCTKVALLCTKLHSPLCILSVVAQLCAVRSPLGSTVNTSSSGEEPRWVNLLINMC